MLADPAILASPATIAVLGLPSLVLAALACMRDAPGEWGLAALSVWTCLVCVLVGGVAVAGLGAVPVLALLVGAFVALVVGGPWGAAIAAFLAALLALAQWTQDAWPLHPIAMPMIAVAGIVAASIALLRR